MRIATPAEAVAGSERPAALRPLRGRDAVLPARRARRLRARAARRPVVHLHCEGPGPPAPEMALRTRHRALSRAERPPRSPGSGGLHPGLPVGCSAPAHQRAHPADAVFINVSRRTSTASPLGTSVEAMQVAIRSAKTVIAQLNRSMPRTLGEFRPRRRHRPCDRGGPAALRAPPERDRDVERRIGSSSRTLSRPGDDPDGDRAIPTAVARCCTASGT